MLPNRRRRADAISLRAHQLYDVEEVPYGGRGGKKYGFTLMTYAIRSYGLADVAFSCNVVSLNVI